MGGSKCSPSAKVTIFGGIKPLFTDIGHRLWGGKARSQGIGHQLWGGQITFTPHRSPSMGGSNFTLPAIITFYGGLIGTLCRQRSPSMGGSTCNQGRKLTDDDHGDVFATKKAAKNLLA